MDNVNESNRIIALIDMDCFYAQVEQQERPESIGKPFAAVQNNGFRIGMVLSANYEARARGVKSAMSVQDAMAKCPDLVIAIAPTQRNKTDLTKFRNASNKVFGAVKEFLSSQEVVVEVASIDEAYLDLTAAVTKILNSRNVDNNIVVTVDDLPTSHIVTNEDPEESVDGWLRRISDDRHLPDLKLAIGARLVEQVRQRIFDETGYHCSAGIGENKMLAKLVCKLHKPKRQTIISRDAVASLFEKTPISDVRNLGGKLGVNICEKFGIETMAQLAGISLNALKEAYKAKTASWLHQLSRGIDLEEVTARQLVKSIGCSKNFLGKDSLRTRAQIKKWLNILTDELEERLRNDQLANRRTARNMCVSIRLGNANSNVSRHCPLTSYESAKIAHEAFRLIAGYNDAGLDAEQWKTPITNLSVSVGRFDDCVDGPSAFITNFFKPTGSSKVDKSLEASTSTSKPENLLETTPNVEIPETTTNEEPFMEEDNQSNDLEISVIPKPKVNADLDERSSSSRSDVCILDGNTNDSVSSASSTIQEIDKVDTNDSSVQSCGSTSNIGPTNFEELDSDGDLDQDTDVLAPTRHGALKRRRLAEETTAAFFSSESESSNKDSFFVKRLQQMRQKEETYKKVDDLFLEAKKAKEEIKRRRVQENVASNILMPIKKRQETNEASSSTTSTTNFVDPEPWIPGGREVVDDETWNNLPPEIRWELKQHFKRHGDEDVIEVPRKSPVKRGQTKKGESKVSEKKKNGARSKRSSATGGNQGNGTKTLSDYFQRSE